MRQRLQAGAETRTCFPHAFGDCAHPPLRKRVEVEDAVRGACRRWNVREVTADPYRWQRSLAVLEAERIPVTEFPQSSQRMTPSTIGLFEALVNRRVTHSGDRRLARHVANAVVKVDSRGTRLQKEHKRSVRRIDAAMAAVMAFSRAADLATQPAGYDLLQSVW